MAKNVRLAKMRELFKASGFDYHKEFILALKDADPQTRLEALVSVAPFFMERLRPEPEEAPSQKDITPPGSPRLAKASEAELLKALEQSEDNEDD